MRVTGGIGKGRKLKAPQGLHVRPTSDKVKQALYNILGEKVVHAIVLDLFAGTGNIGIEALSRGADRAVFVDSSRNAQQAIKQNVESAGFTDRAQVVAVKAESFLKSVREQFDIIFLDPPYAYEQEPLLSAVAGSGILKPDSVVISEHFRKQASPERADVLVLYREARYGDTVLAFYRS